MSHKQFDFRYNDRIAGVFETVDDKAIILKRLFGLSCGAGDSYRTRGLAVVETNLGRFEAGRLTLKQSTFDEKSACLTFVAGETLRLESRWKLCDKTGVWTRRDTLHNDSDEMVVVSRCLARYTFLPSRYEYFSQSSFWCNENQGIWQDVTHGTVALGCEGGRTTQGGTPYMCLRDKDTRSAVAFHIVCQGNWTIKIRACTPENRVPLPFITVELGHADESLALELPPNTSVKLPEILIHDLPDGTVESAAPSLHQHLLDEYFVSAKPYAPVVYNTWFDVFECLDVERLCEQLAAAKQIGCEVFTVDAGWYGQGDGFWHEQIGDWREKLDGAFGGNMKAFADEVRDAGLKFGLWMEPERNFPTVPVMKEHPEWFIEGAGGCFYPNLCRQDAYDYVFSEMSRLIDTYDLGWIKIDFNFELSTDPTGSEFGNYYRQWYKLLDELRAKYPGTFMEGCAAGGMRLEIATMSHHDGHFLSDNINPTDVLRMRQQALLRLPPGRIGKWIGLRSVGKTIAKYAVPIEDTPESIVTPSGFAATWEKTETVDLDFATRVGMVGMAGFTGDIAGLSNQAKVRLAEHVAFYKQWREFITGSVAHLLTPVRLKNDHGGWVALQLQNAMRPENLLLVYRLDDGRDEINIPLRNLDIRQRYTITNKDSNGEPEIMTGARLINDGLTVALSERFRAAVIIIDEK